VFLKSGREPDRAQIRFRWSGRAAVAGGALVGVRAARLVARDPKATKGVDMKYLLQFFAYEHLTAYLQAVSKPFAT